MVEIDFRAIREGGHILQNRRQWMGTSPDLIGMVVDTSTVRTLDGISLLSPANRKELMHCCKEFLNGVP